MDLKDRIRQLPTQPGVYRLKGTGGRVLYVGKASNLRSRVRSYLGEGGDGRPSAPYLARQVRDVDVVVTPTTKDALLLENELIKRHRPRYNVKLRDDKQYLGLRLDPRESWPRLSTVRRFREDGAHYFGPYTSSSALRETLRNLRRIFPLRSCSDVVFRDYARRGRPCIEYEMRRCAGPCCERVAAEDYAALVRGTERFLRGQSEGVMRELEERMQEAAAQERFEDAARIRDRLTAARQTLEKQQVVSDQPIDRDVFGWARRGRELEIHRLQVRGGRVVGATGFSFSEVRIPDSEALSSFLGQLYTGVASGDLPDELLTAIPVEDGDLLAVSLSEHAARPVTVRTPRRGARDSLVDTARANAELRLSERLAARESVRMALRELEQKLGLPNLPERIECYDVSAIQGTLAVASRVVFVDGKPEKSAYRRYRVRTAAPGDDYAALREVMARRLARAEREPLPDLLVIDGGRGQLAVATEALRQAGQVAPAVGLAKHREGEGHEARVRRHRGLKPEPVFVAGRKPPVRLPADSPALLLLQRIRDESHRFAIALARDLRRKQGLTSVLEELPGIGPAKRKALLARLGSLRAVRRATLEELGAVPGISARDAQAIRSFFAEEEQSSPGIRD